MAIAIATELAKFPGGPDALAGSLAASAEAMRPLRWPAERLDTLGGYLTYHNVVLVTFLLALYGAVHGARAIRGDEERQALALVLSTGVSRPAVVLERTVGFALTLVLIALGLGLGTALGMAAGGDPDPIGSLVSMGIAGLVGLVGYGLGLVVAQFTSSSRAATGVGVVVLTVLYVATNLGEELGPFGALRFASPFYYANFSRALVPGYGLDLPATAVLLVMAGALVALAIAAFALRDYAAPLWPRRREDASGHLAVAIPQAMLGSVWTGVIRRGWFGLIAWASGAASVMAVMALLQPAVLEVWSRFEFLDAVTSRGAGTTAETAYWSFSAEVIAPLIAAFAISRAAGWVADLDEGRVEVVLAGPMSWIRLVTGRLVALYAGVAILTAGALVGLTVGAASVGGTLDVAGLGRLTVGSMLLGAALGGAAALVVAAVPRSLAVTALAVLVGAAYLLTYVVPLFGWPEWLARLSVFWAFGHPYLEWPSASALIVLATLAALSGVLAALVAERSPKVA